MTPSWYDVLDVERTASADEIRAAWRSGIADLEPGSRRFQTLNQAAEVLLDERKRAAYDEELADQAPEPTEEVDHSGTGSTVSAGSIAEPTESRARVSIPTWLLALLGVVAAACLAAAFFMWRSEAGESTEDATRAAQSAAEQAVEPLLSYDYETLEADQKRAGVYLTAGYREKYDQLFGLIEDNAPAVQPKVVANAFASAIVRSGDERVEVLLFVDQLTLNKGMSGPVNFKNQVTVTMQKVDDEWLIDNLVTTPPTQ